MSKKKDSKLVLPKIRDRFFRIALSRPENNELQHVAVVHHADGSSRLMNRGDFEALVAAGTGAAKGVVAMQPYVRPKGGAAALYRNEFHRRRRNKGGGMAGGAPATNTRRVMGHELVQSHATRINAQLDTTTRAMARSRTKFRRERFPENL